MLNLFLTTLKILYMTHTFSQMRKQTTFHDIQDPFGSPLPV